MSSEATSKLFFEAVVRFYGLPDEVLHDRDPGFTADFWRELWKLLGSRAVFHQPVTHRLMGGLRECIALLSGPSDVCWLKETYLKSSAANCWPMLSLLSILPLLRALGRFSQNLPLGSCHAHHLMWWSKLVAMLGLETLSFTSRTCFREPRLTC